MNIQAMLLPHKHVRFGGSLIGIAGYIRANLHEPKSIDELWALIDSTAINKAVKPSFTQMVLAINILFAIKTAVVATDGRIHLLDHTMNDNKDAI